MSDNRVLETLEKIEGHLETLVDLALASGLAASTERTSGREERGIDREETRDYRATAKGERSDIKDAVDEDHAPEGRLP